MYSRGLNHQLSNVLKLYNIIWLTLICPCAVTAHNKDKDKDKDKDLFIDPQEFVVGYSKAPEQLQSSARPMCHSHATSEPATLRIAA